jgi:hypothetical protein
MARSKTFAANSVRPRILACANALLRVLSNSSLEVFVTLPDFALVVDEPFLDQGSFLVSSFLRLGENSTPKCNARMADCAYSVKVFFSMIPCATVSMTT